MKRRGGPQSRRPQAGPTSSSGQPSSGCAASTARGMQPAHGSARRTHQPRAQGRSSPEGSSLCQPCVVWPARRGVGGGGGAVRRVLVPGLCVLYVLGFWTLHTLPGSPPEQTMLSKRHASLLKDKLCEPWRVVEREERMCGGVRSARGGGGTWGGRVQREEPACTWPMRAGAPPAPHLLCVPAEEVVRKVPSACVALRAGVHLTPKRHQVLRRVWAGRGRGCCVRRGLGRVRAAGSRT